MIEIDGSLGGGQILRTSLSLSAISKKPFRITNIRIKRNNPGLKYQHLTAVNSIKEFCNAEVKGNELNSLNLEFYPGNIKPGKYKFDIGTAGSTTLVFQTLLPAAILQDKETILEIKGGTANPLAPPALELNEVFLFFLEKLGIKVKLEVIKEGFTPLGDGLIKAIIYPNNKIEELNLIENEEIIETHVYAVTSESLRERNISGRLVKGFRSSFNVETKIKSEKIYVKTASPGCYIHANSIFKNYKLGYTILGEKNKTAEQVGKECAQKLSFEINLNATVDSFTADQLLIYMALKGKGKIKTSKITDHIKSNMEVIEKFLDVKFKIEDNIISL